MEAIKKTIIPQFSISIRPETKEKHENFHGRISLMNKKSEEIAYVEFSKSKKERKIYIDYVFVGVEYRQKRLGRMLVSILENLTIFLDCYRIYSNTVSEEGELLLSSMGYKKNRKGEYCKRVGRK